VLRHVRVDKSKKRAHIVLDREQFTSPLKAVLAKTPRQANVAPVSVLNTSKLRLRLAATKASPKNQRDESTQKFGGNHRYE
jgi:hypothetical protein